MRNREVERAKQFLPFSALKGLEEVLCLKEKEMERSFGVNGDIIEMINKIEIGNSVKVWWWGDRKCFLYGVVTEINMAKKYLRVENKIIYFEQIELIESMK